jgi:predicted HicB family RNase H-like nuclease
MKAPATVADKMAGPVSLSKTNAVLPTIPDLNSLKESHHGLRIKYESLRIDFEILSHKHRLMISEHARLKEVANNSVSRQVQMKEIENVKRELAAVNERLSRNGAMLTKETVPTKKVVRKKPRLKKKAVITIRMSQEMRRQLKSMAHTREESMNHMLLGVLENLLDG